MREPQEVFKRFGAPGLFFSLDTLDAQLCAVAGTSDATPRFLLPFSLLRVLRFTFARRGEPKCVLLPFVRRLSIKMNYSPLDRQVHVDGDKDEENG